MFVKGLVHIGQSLVDLLSLFVIGILVSLGARICATDLRVDNVERGNVVEQRLLVNRIIVFAIYCRP